MGSLNVRDAYEYDPEAYASEGGGVPGMLRRAVILQSEQGIDFSSILKRAPEFDSSA